MAPVLTPCIRVGPGAGASWPACLACHVSESQREDQGPSPPHTSQTHTNGTSWVPTHEQTSWGTRRSQRGSYTQVQSVTKSPPEGGGHSVPWTQAPCGVTGAAGRSVGLTTGGEQVRAAGKHSSAQTQLPPWPPPTTAAAGALGRGPQTFPHPWAQQGPQCPHARTGWGTQGLTSSLTSPPVSKHAAETIVQGSAFRRSPLPDVTVFTSSDSHQAKQCRGQR